jgi:uncharacterized lipoprotein YehR (DUF1307 family)
VSVFEEKNGNIMIAALLLSSSLFSSCKYSNVACFSNNSNGIKIKLTYVLDFKTINGINMKLGVLVNQDKCRTKSG